MIKISINEDYTIGESLVWQVITPDECSLMIEHCRSKKIECWLRDNLLIVRYIGETDKIEIKGSRFMLKAIAELINVA